VLTAPQRSRLSLRRFGMPAIVSGSRRSALMSSRASECTLSRTLIESGIWLVLVWPFSASLVSDVSLNIPSQHPAHIRRAVECSFTLSPDPIKQWMRFLNRATVTGPCGSRWTGNPRTLLAGARAVCVRGNL
jgi:hypothetical protein